MDLIKLALVLISIICLAGLIMQRVEYGAVFVLTLDYIILPATGLFLNSIDIKGISLYPEDLIVLVLVISFLLRLLVLGVNRINTSQRNLLAIFIGLFLLSLGIGFKIYSTGAFVEARRYLVVIAPLLYFSSFRYSRKKLVDLTKILVIACIVLSVIGIIKFAIGGTGASIDTTSQAYLTVRTDIGISTRGIVILITWICLMIMQLNGHLEKYPAVKLLNFFLPAMLILLQERTLWVIAFVCFLYFLSKNNRRFYKYVIALALLVLVLVPIVYALKPLSVGNLVNSLQGAFKTMFYNPNFSGQNVSTLAVRIDGWIVLLKNHPLSGYLYGVPFGAGYTRIIGDVIYTFNPHNFYVIHILRLGLFGMLSYLFSLLLLLVNYWRVKLQAQDIFFITCAEILVLSILTILLDSMTYSLQPLGGAIWGLAIGLMSNPDFHAKQYIPPKNVLAT